MTTKISIVATFVPKSGKEREVEAILRGMVSPTRGELGCIRYDLYRNEAERVSFVLFEIYKDQSALQFHRDSAHYKTYRANIADLLNEAIQVAVLHDLDVAK